MVHVAKHGAFFAPSELTREVNCHFFANELGDLQCTIKQKQIIFNIILFQKLT